MSEAAVRIFSESFFRCIADPRFADRFYLRLLNSPPAEATNRFRLTVSDRVSTAFQQCVRAVHEATVLGTGDYSALSCLADRYSRRQANIRPEHYVLWLDSLIATVAELDPCYSDEVGAAWREAFRPAIEYMISLS